jgi:hypothetical protein
MRLLLKSSILKFFWVEMPQIGMTPVAIDYIILAAVGRPEPMLIDISGYPRAKIRYHGICFDVSQFEVTVRQSPPS